MSSEENHVSENSREATVSSDSNDGMKEAMFSIGVGTLITFFGSIGFMFISLATRIVILRMISVEQWGEFILAISVTSLLSSIAPLGIDTALSRNISYLDPDKGKSHAFTGMILSIIEGIVFTILAFFSAPFLGKIFHDMKIVPILEIVAPSILFGNVSSSIVAIARGYKDTLPNALFQNIMRPLLFVTLSVALYYNGVGFLGIVLAQLFASIINMIVSIIYLRNRSFVGGLCHFNVKEAADLILMGIPLLLVGISSYFMVYTDTLILGLYKNEIAVAYYTASGSLSKVIFVGINALGFIILPVASGMFRRRKISEIGRIYSSVTKWNLVVSVPLFMVLFYFPKQIIYIAFGAKYEGASLPLQILSLGSLLATFIGPSSNVLVATNNTRMISFSSIIGAIMSILAAFLTVPYIGAAGAAFASVLGTFSYRFLSLLFVFKNNGIHPFRSDLIKPLLVSVVLPSLIILIFRPNLGTIGLIVFIIVIFIFTVFSILFTHSIEETDQFILFFIEGVFHRKLKMVRKVARLFVRNS